MNKDLKIVVDGLNYMNSHIKKALPDVLSQVKEFAGKQILLASGKTSSKFNIKFPVITEGPEKFQHNPTQFWFDVSNYSIWLHVKFCLNGGSYDVHPVTAFTEYFEEDIYIGGIKNGVLTELRTEEVLIEDHKLDTVLSVEGVTQLVSDFKATKEASDKLYNSIHRKIVEKEHLRK